MEVPELLKQFKYRLLTEYDEPQKQKIEGLLTGVNLNQPIYAKIYSKRVETRDQETDELLWNTQIIFASFFFITGEEILDNFFVPVRAFRIRTSYEKYEAENLIREIFDDILEIKSHFGITKTEDDDFDELFTKPGRA